MRKPRSKRAKRQALLAKLEDMIAHECYNAKIQNWGPHGTYEGEGREFRYPTTYIDAQGRKHKRWSEGADLLWNEFRSGHYLFGTNQLHIVHALGLVVDYLEKNHGLKFD